MEAWTPKTKWVTSSQEPPLYAHVTTEHLWWQAESTDKSGHKVPVLPKNQGSPVEKEEYHEWAIFRVNPVNRFYRRRTFVEVSRPKNFPDPGNRQSYPNQSEPSQPALLFWPCRPV